MKKIKKQLLITTLFSLVVFTTTMFFSCFSYAQNLDSLTTDSNLLDIDFEKLIKYKSKGLITGIDAFTNESISSSSMNNSDKDINIRKAPSNISVFTSDDIKKMGVKDLNELLNYISDIDFGVDVLGAVGIVMRGLWSQEGKVLVLVDGQAFNETVYGTVQFGNGAFNIEAIKKVEIIKGPSAISYGGIATNGVINIITKNAYDQKSFNAGTMQSFGTEGLTRTMYYANGGTFINKNLSFVINSSWGINHQSEFDYKDIYGTSYNMHDNGNSNPVNFNIKINWKNTQVHSTFNALDVFSRDGYRATYKAAYKYQNYVAAVDIKQKIKITDRLNLLAFGTFNNYGAYITKDTTLAKLLNDTVYSADIKQAQRFSLGANLNWTPAEKIDVTSGVLAYNDIARQDPLTPIYPLSNNAIVSYQNIAAYSQFIYKNAKTLNVFIGLRAEFNNYAGFVIAPKLALTKKYKNFNAKLMLSRTFRTPLVANIQYSPPGNKAVFESGIAYEAELGYSFFKRFYVTYNYFTSVIKNNLTYFVITDKIEGYLNSQEPFGSRGSTFGLNYKEQKIKAVVNYSYINNNIKYFFNNQFSSDINQNNYMGIAPHKLTARITVDFTSKIYSTFGYIFKSRRSAITSIDTSGTYIESLLPTTHLLNFYIGTSNLIMNNLDLGLGISNVLNQRNDLIQPYKGGHAPLPQLGREIYIKAIFSIKDKSNRFKKIFGE